MNSEHSVSSQQKCLKLNSASFTCCRCWGGWSQILRIGGFWKLPSRVPTFPTTSLLVFCSISPDVVCLLIWIPENDLSDVGVSRGTFTWKTDSFMKIDSNQIKWSFGFHLDVSRMVRSSSSSSSSPPSSPFFPSLVGLQVIWLHTMCPNMFNGSPDHCLCFDPWVHGSNALHHSLSKHVSPAYLL